MLKVVKDFFTKNVGLKITAFILASALWFYIVGELKKGNEEERRIFNKIILSTEK